jgi:hypothetical protein
MNSRRNQNSKALLEGFERLGKVGKGDGNTLFPTETFNFVQECRHVGDQTASKIEAFEASEKSCQTSLPRKFSCPLSHF